MFRHRVVRWTSRLLRIGLAVAMIYAGATKWSDLSSFVRTVGQFGIVDDALVRATAIALLAIELTAAVALLFGRRGALVALGGLLTLYALVLSYGMWRGLDIDCGCFGPNDPLAGHGLSAALVRVLILLALCGVLMLMRSGSHPRADDPSDPADHES